MRVAITGATGLLGANLAVLLRQAGHEVTCTRRAGSRTHLLDGHGVTWADADLSSPEALARAFDGAERVFHCAAAVSVRRRATPELVATNVDGTRNVIAAVKQSGAARLVYCSSVVAVGLSDDGQPSDETRPWNFDKYGLDDGYAVTKRDAEAVVQAAAGEGLDVVTVNPTYMFGPFDQRPSSGQMIVEVTRGHVPALSTGKNNFVDVRDVCRGMITAGERGRRGERYILGGENMSYADILRHIAGVAKVRPPQLTIARWVAAPLGWAGDLQESMTSKEPFISSIKLAWVYADNFIFSSAKAARELGYTTGPIERAIADALAWFRQRNMV